MTLPLFLASKIQEQISTIAEIHISYNMRAISCLPCKSEVKKNRVKISNCRKKDMHSHVNILPFTRKKELNKVLYMEHMKQIIYLHFEEYKWENKK